MGAATKSAAAARDEILRDRATIKDLVTARLPPHLLKGIYSDLAGVVFVFHSRGESAVLHYLGIEQFRATPLVRQPFEHLIVPQFIGPQALAEINADYPKISTSGSFAVDQVAFGPAFRSLLDELNSDAFREAFEDKFDIELSGRPTITTVRGRCGPGDGKIHTDSVTKIITVLIYMHETWDQPGGRLRLLRSSLDLNDVIVEVPPIAGTLLAFKRSNNSWHGHEPFVGERRVIQFNWLTSKGNRQIAMLRHHTSASFKRLLQMVMPGRLAHW